MSEIELPNPGELEERRDKAFSRRVALTTAVYAAVLAIASLGGNYAMKEMLLAQQEATNQWSYYQAKVVREHLNRGNRLILEMYLAEPSGLRAADRAKYETLARTFGEQEQRMAADKKEIEKEARTHEKIRDRNRAKDPYFDFAEVLMQIAIVTASVSILSTSRPVFRFSMVLAIAGALLAANGFFLLVNLPLFH